MIKKMKRLVLTLGFCLVAVVCFGQKKAVSDALKLAKDAKPNFVEARNLIKGALQHPETKDDAKTWYTAGQIENSQFDKENIKLLTGQTPNEDVMYNALLAIYPYFAKTYELDNLPDAKGKVKPKYVKDMKAITKVNLPHYINGGAYFYEKSDFKKAFAFWDQYVTISDSKMMREGEPPTLAVDSNYIIANYYCAMAALLIDPATAVPALKRASKQDFKQNDVYQYLAEAYLTLEDVDNYEKTLIEGFGLFPTETYFYMNLIKIYIDNDKNDKALEYTQIAINKDPENAQLFNVLGIVYESGFKDYAKAEEAFLKAIAADGENADSQANLGRIYYNQGVAQLDVANDITDVKKYNEEKEKAKVLFRKALPYYEKSFSLTQTIFDVKIALRNIYYQLDMGDKYEAIDKLLGE